MFQHTAARRRLEVAAAKNQVAKWFQHTAARRRLVNYGDQTDQNPTVSTHSRPKAAGSYCLRLHGHSLCFNTQPPEGGWEGRLLRFQIFKVSTHSRPKAAGCNCYTDQGSKISGFNTQPPEGGWEATGKYYEAVAVSTHSRPKAAGRRCRRV